MNKDIKIKELEERENQIKKEKNRLKKIFRSLGKDRLQIVENLIQNAAFMTVTLHDLEEKINKNGTISKYKNGENQYGTKKSPEVEVYNTMVKNYTSIIKNLTDQLPPGEDNPLKNGGELAEFVLKQ